MSTDKVFEIVIPESGKSYKFGKDIRGATLIDFPNDVIIRICQDTSSIDCYLPDENGIYHYAGDLSFNNYDGFPAMHFHSRAISSMKFNGAIVPVRKNSNGLIDLSVGLDVNKSISWFEPKKI